MAASQTSRVSVSQLEKLLDFLENHEDLALGHCRSNEGRQRNKRLWNEVASILNSIGDGANKDGAGWSKYWTIFKNRLKNKIRTDRAARRQTGAGPSNVVFTPLEERAINIIGSDAGAPLRGVQVDPFRSQGSVEVQEEIALVEIRQEDQENVDIILDSEFVDENVDQIIEQYSHPSPGPSAAPVTPAPATASIPPAAPRPIRRQRSRPRLHSLSEARADILRLEEARVAAEARHAEVLQQIPAALHAIAAAISELAAVFRREHQEYEEDPTMSANVILGCVMALLIILFTISSMARYYIKFTLFVVMSLIFATAPVPLMLIKPFDPRNALIPSMFLRAFARILGLRWKVRGLENVDNSRGAVVLLNHQSCLDLYALAIIWPLMSRCTVVSKRSLQYLVPFGTATWLWGTVFIDRGAQTARDALNKQVDAIKNQKRKLLLFPEGTRHSGDRLLPFRKGAFHVAMDAGAPIQPVVISKYHYLDGKRHKFGSGEFIVSILPMIETEGMAKEDIVALIEKTQRSMQEEFTKISAETLARRNLRTKAD